MRILVTGGLGYIGSHVVVELIKNNHTVVIVDNLINSKIEVLEKLKQITKKKPIFCRINITLFLIEIHVVKDIFRVDFSSIK